MYTCVHTKIPKAKKLIQKPKIKIKTQKTLTRTQNPKAETRQSKPDNQNPTSYTRTHDGVPVSASKTAKDSRQDHT
jgi:hypothetical protein